MPVSLKNIHTQIRQRSDIANVTKFEKIDESGYIYLGTYTFLIMLAFRLNEVIACFVDEVKKLNKKSACKKINREANHMLV